jgi:hypothetical protein
MADDEVKLAKVTTDNEGTETKAQEEVEAKLLLQINIDGVRVVECTPKVRQGN